jgi:cob(I)alamin adenosyltransferase
MTKKSKIYTRGGDSGHTSLIGGERVKKCSLRLEAYGTIDELSSHLGLLRSIIKADKELNDEMFDDKLFEWIQSRLFDVGTHLAMPCKQSATPPSCTIAEQHIAHLESLIDQIDGNLPSLHSFILPGGCMAASQCHVCRTVCRRAERLIISLAETAPIDPLVVSFTNRLSDFLFVFARFINKLKSVDEISWKNDCI